MLCILSFFVFAILGIFSASHRELAKKAWYCLVRKIQFKPCDINFNEELKGKMLGKLIFTHPRLGSFLYKWADVLSIVFVVLSVWSLWAVVRSSVYLLAYDTCDPYSEEGCSLAGDSCTINVGSISFLDAARSGLVMDWTTLHLKTFGEAVTRIPNRFKTWNAEEFLPANPSYYADYDAGKPTALEVIDPSCKFCGELFKNIKTAGFENRYNLTYVAYPIPNSDGTYRFPNSMLIARYLEATKTLPRLNGAVADWYILEQIFTGKDEDGTSWQDKFIVVYDETQAEAKLQDFLREAGHTEEAVALVADAVRANAMADALEQNRVLVEEQIKTIKIPTIIFGGDRYDRLVDADTLSKR